MPPSLTAATGLDALTQLAEAFVSRRANAMTDALCVAGIPRAAAALPRVYRDGTDLEAREAMSLASLWSGMALANGGLGAVHGFAGPIGGMFGAPHGAVCAALLPHVVAANLAAVERAGNAATLERFAALARLLTGVPHALPADAVTFLRTLCGRLEVQPLGAFGVTPSRIAEIVAHARRASSMKGNPIELSDAELTQALAAAI
jgi:alcohol dehydrogenase class IV